MPNNDAQFIFETYTGGKIESTNSSKPEDSSTKPTSIPPTPAADKISKLKARGLDVKEWTVPGMPTHLQITLMNDKGPSKGASLYVPADMAEDVILKAIEQKRRYFQQ